MVNVERLRRELEFITANPANWNQQHWYLRTACGTTGCLAGNVALREGYVPNWAYSVNTVDGRSTGWINRCDDDDDEGRSLHVEEVAATVLGLTDDEADRLFDGSNDLRDLWEIAAELTHGAIKVPSDVPSDQR